MDNLDKYINALNLESSVIDKILSYPEFVKDIKENLEFAIYNSESLFSNEQSNRTNFFLSHILAFKNYRTTLLLSSDIENTFNLNIIDATNIAVIISSNPNTETKNFCKNVLSMFESLLSVSKNEIISCISSNPKILKLSMKNYYHNLYYLGNKYKLEKQTLKTIFFHSPFLFAKTNLLSSVNILYKCLALSTKEFNEFMVKHYTLCLFPASTIRKNIASLIYMFEFSDFEVVSLVRANPKILLTPKQSLFNTSRSVMRNFSISERQFKLMLAKFPKLATLSADKINKKFEALNSLNLFVKRDLKDMVLASPEILTYSNQKIANNILNISKQLYLTTPSEITKFVRLCPNAIAINDIKEKLKSFDNLKISREYIRIAPSVLKEESIITGIKNTLLYPFNLSFELDKVIDIDYSILTSRIKYLSLNRLDIKDSILSPEMFELSHKLSNKTLYENYKPDISDYKKLIKLTCEKTKKYSQAYIKLTSFLSRDYISSIKLGIILINENNNIPNSGKNDTEINYILSSLGLDSSSVKRIMKIIPIYINSTRIFANLELLDSYGLNREQIIKLVTQKPTILLASTKSLGQRFQELAFEFNDNLFEVCKHI